MITELQKALGELESSIRFLQPDKLRWKWDRKELIDQLDHIKELARKAETRFNTGYGHEGYEVITNGDKKLKEMLEAQSSDEKRS